MKHKKKALRPVKKAAIKPKNQAVKKMAKSSKKAVKAVKKTGVNQVKRKRPKNAHIGEFKKGVSGNPKGRPPKLLRHIIDELKEKGYEAVSPSQVTDGYQLLFNLPMKQIAHYVNDDASPMFLRIIAKAMVGGKGPEMLERMLDRANGKAKQSVDVQAVVKNDIDLSHLSLEDLLKLKNAKPNNS